MAKIVGVDKGSIAEEMGVEIGDELLGFNGEPMQDILDYCYYEGQESFIINMRAKQGDLVDLDIEKSIDENLGMALDDSVQLTPIRCKNKCVFCFVDQLPKGMRETLYVKDDDYRLSFTSGSYVTLTNTTQKDLDRIVKYHLSPLYISVHCYDKAIKKLLISNPEGMSLFNKMEFLSKNGIAMHTQIVMCKNLNDKEKLEETLLELHKLGPQIKTVAVVPVGMTGHREKLYKLEPIDKVCAIETIKLVESINEKFGGDFCWCSDEFYIKANMTVPNVEYYGNLDQLENGVGLCSTFMQEIEDSLNDVEVSDKQISFGCITGQSFKGYLGQALELIKTKYPNMKAKIFDIENNFFGKSITVAGLITAKDIIAQVHDAPHNIIIPSNMLREFTTTFLDGVSVEELEQKLNAKIFINHGANDLVRIIGEM